MGKAVNIWLDDVREPPPGWVWARNAREAASVLLTVPVTYASLDHDLNDGHYDGTWLVNWMIEKNIWPKHKPGVHSANPWGALRMLALITAYGPYVER